MRTLAVWEERASPPHGTTCTTPPQLLLFCGLEAMSSTSLVVPTGEDAAAHLAKLPSPDGVLELTGRIHADVSSLGMGARGGRNLLRRHVGGLAAGSWACGWPAVCSGRLATTATPAVQSAVGAGAPSRLCCKAGDGSATPSPSDCFAGNGCAAAC